jgi:hypothetical protein
MSSLYNMVVLAGLLAYGLFNLPIFLWGLGDLEGRLFELMQRVETVKTEYRASLVEFYFIVA